MSDTVSLIESLFLNALQGHIGAQESMKPLPHSWRMDFPVPGVGKSEWRDEHKENIQRLRKAIKTFSQHYSKIVVRGRVPLKVFIGRKYPARLAVKYEQGWSQVR